MINEIILAGSFFVGAIIVQIIGTNLSDKRNHKRNLRRMKYEQKNKIKYLKERIFFERKLEYFEKIAQAIDDNILYYTMVIEKTKQIIENKKKINIQKINDILGNSKLLALQASPLYSDNLKPTAIGIVKFLRAQTEINEILEKISSSDEKNKIMELKELSKKLMDAGKETVEKMRLELISETR